MTPGARRLFAAAFLADMALYLALTGAPYQALALGAGPLVVGLIPAARALPYLLTTVWAGGRTRSGSRLGLTPFSYSRVRRGRMMLGRSVSGSSWGHRYISISCSGER